MWCCEGVSYFLSGGVVGAQWVLKSVINATKSRNFILR